MKRSDAEAFKASFALIFGENNNANGYFVEVLTRTIVCDVLLTDHDRLRFLLDAFDICAEDDEYPETYGGWRRYRFFLDTEE